MPVDVIMPKVDMVMEHGTVVRWYRREHELVTVGEPLLEIETDKSTIDVEAPATGRLTGVTAQPGDTVPVATRIALILAPGEQVVEETPSPPAPPPPAGALPRPRATPAARALARHYGLDLHTLIGSGPQGRVRRVDVLQAAEAHTQNTPTTSSSTVAATLTTPELPPTPTPPTLLAQEQRHLEDEEGELLPLVGVRRLVAERLMASAAIPTFVLTVDVEMTALLRIRERLPFRPSLTSLIARAVAPLLCRHPELNRSFRTNGIWQHQAVHLGIAMDSDGQLLVPVIRHAQRLTLRELHAELTAIRERAAARRLGPAELRGSSFSISNLGMFGVDTVTAVINPPEAAILAIGRTVERPVGRNGELVLRPMATLTLSVDHRVADGAAAARFLADLRAAMEEPFLLL